MLRGFYIENPVCPSNGKGLFIRKKAHDFILVSILRSTLGEDPNKCIILRTSQLAAFLNKVNSSMMLKEYHIYLQKSTQAFNNDEEEQPKKSKYMKLFTNFLLVRVNSLQKVLPANHGLCLALPHQNLSTRNNVRST